MWTSIDITKEQIDEFGREFRKKARFVIDESLGVGVAMALRDYGWNAVYVEEIGLAGHSDEDVFAFAWKEDRVLLTHDRDFLDDRRFPFHRNPGLIVLPGADGSGAGLIEALRSVMSLVGQFREAYRGDKIEITEDGIWTIRGFDRKLGRHYKNRFRFAQHGKVYQWQTSEDDNA